MQKIVMLLFIATISLLSGCAANHYNVPQEYFSNKVKILGVAPILVDPASEIKHPQKEALIALLTEKNRSYESALSRKLKSTGNFYTVASIGGDADTLFKKLLFRSENRDDATIKYNKYFWKSDEIKNYIKSNGVDAVLIAVVSGLTAEEKIYSSNLLTSLKSNYNKLIMTAQIIDENGTILWEYPNFRKRFLSYSEMINLQYPDFSESEANKSNITEVKFKTIDGLRRAFDEKKKDYLLRETQEPAIYTKQFDEMISLITFDGEKGGKEAPVESAPAVSSAKEEPIVAAKPLAPNSSQKVEPVADTKPVQPATEINVPAVTKVPVIEKPSAQPSSTATTPAAVEIAPATESTK